MHVNTYSLNRGSYIDNNPESSHEHAIFSRRGTQPDDVFEEMPRYS